MDNLTMIRRMSIILLALSFVLACFNYTCAVILDNPGDDGGKTPSMVNRATLSSIQKPGDTNKTYAPGEVIIKLKVYRQAPD